MQKKKLYTLLDNIYVANVTKVTLVQKIWDLFLMVQS